MAEDGDVCTLDRPAGSPLEDDACESNPVLEIRDSDPKSISTAAEWILATAAPCTLTR